MKNTKTMLFKSGRIEYANLNIFQEAAQSKADGYGYHAWRHTTVWQSKKCGWNRVFINAGIRRSNKWQAFPIWNTSHNSQRSLMFGCWLLYFEIGYYRKHWCYHNVYFEKLPFQKKLGKLYRLFFFYSRGKP